MTEVVLVAMLLSVAVFTVPRKMKWALTMFITTAVSAAFFAVSIKVLIDGQALSSEALGLPIVTNGTATIDMLSAFFIAVVSIAAVSMVLYSRGYLKKYNETKPPVQITLHYFSMMQLFFSILFLLMLRDGFGFLFSWELMTISSFLLVMFFGEKPGTRKAALNYLFMMHIGFVALVAGFVMLRTAGLESNLDSLTAYFATNDMWPVFLAFLLGFGMKAGLFPLHIWLPEADPAAPGHVAGFMSGVMTKMGVYGLLRVVSALPGNGSMDAGLVLFIAGIVTSVWGVVLAVMQSDIRRKLAYSTMENVGIIITGIGFGLVARASGANVIALIAFGGAILHVAVHCFGKMILFMGAGNIYTSAGTNKIDMLGGLNRKMPVTSILFLVGILSLCALPPLAGFTSEFMLLLGMFKGVGGSATVSIVSVCGILFLALVGGMVVMAFTKLYGVVFLGRGRSEKAKLATEAGADRLSAMALPLAMILLIGVLPVWFFDMAVGLAGSALGSHSAFTVSSLLSKDVLTLAYALLFMVAMIVILWVIRKYTVKSRSVSESPTWMCGFPAVTPKMQYTGESFADGLGRISGRFMKNTGVAERPETDEIFPAPHRFNIGHGDKMGELFSVWWVGILRMVNTRFTRIRSGKVNHYVFFALLYLLLILVLTIFKII